MLLQYLDDYKEVYAYRHVQVEVHVEECFRLEMSESLATVLLTDLMKNEKPRALQDLDWPW